MSRGRPKTAPGQEWGQQAAQQQAMSVMPLGQQPAPSAPQIAPPPGAPSGAPPGGAPPAPPVQPGQFGNILAPTNLPNQPVTDGAPFGPGTNITPAQPMAPTPIQRALAALVDLPDSASPQIKALRQQLQVNASQSVVQ